MPGPPRSGPRPPRFPCPGPFRAAGNLAFEFGIDTDALQDGSSLKQPRQLVLRGPEHGHVMLKLIRLHEAAPGLLLLVESLLTRHPLRSLHAAFGEREHLKGAALRATARRAA